MPARSLYTAFLLAGTNPGALRPSMVTTVDIPGPSKSLQAFVERGYVSAITDVSVVVSFQGNQELVRRATDEPVFPGQQVFVSRDSSGRLVLHGSIH